MKKELAVLATVSILFPNICFAYGETKSQYDKIYENQPVLSFHYDGNEDPVEINDYQQYINSPYPLLRISMTLKNKTVTVKPGYYLLTPRAQDGYDFVMFKQNGKIAYLIPVYEKQKIDPNVIFPKPPKKKTPLWKWPFIGIGKLFSPLFPKKQTPAKEKQFIVRTLFQDGGKYFEIWIYQDDGLYKMIFTPIK